jgi:hypothetical protein
VRRIHPAFVVSAQPRTPRLGHLPPAQTEGITSVASDRVEHTERAAPEAAKSVMNLS